MWGETRYDNVPKYIAAFALNTNANIASSYTYPYSPASIIAVLCHHQNKNLVKQTNSHPLAQDQYSYLGKFRRLNQNRKSWKV